MARLSKIAAIIARVEADIARLHGYLELLRDTTAEKQPAVRRRGKAKAEPKPEA